jgi:hypothetical protein
LNSAGFNLSGLGFARPKTRRLKPALLKAYPLMPALRRMAIIGHQLLKAD